MYFKKILYIIIFISLGTVKSAYADDWFLTANIDGKFIRCQAPLDFFVTYLHWDRDKWKSINLDPYIMVDKAPSIFRIIAEYKDVGAVIVGMKILKNRKKELEVVFFKEKSTCIKLQRQ